MSVLAILPPVISAVKFVYSRRWDLLHSVRRLLRLCRAGVMYLVNCIKPALARDTHLPSTRPISLSPRLALQEVSVTFPNPSPPLTLTHTHSPRDILPEESQQPEDRTLSLPDLPIQPGSQRDRALPKLPQSSSSLVVDVPLAVVHDIILTYRYGTIRGYDRVSRIDLCPAWTQSLNHGIHSAGYEGGPAPSPRTRRVRCLAIVIDSRLS